MDGQSIYLVPNVLGVIGALTIFGILIYVVRAKKGLSLIQIVLLLIAFLLSLALIGGQVRVVSSISSGEADEK